MAIPKSYIDKLIKYLRIPSISAQGSHKDDMTKACKWLQKTLQNRE